MTLDVRVYLVTDPSYPSLAALVSAAIAGGVTLLQVRDKQAVPADRARTVRQISAAVDARVPVIVDDDVETARTVAGVHLGAHDVAPGVARSSLGPGAIIGWSIGDPAQLEDDGQLAACDYVAASPVWSTPTKPDAGPPLGLDGLRALAVRLQGRLPLVAIGGIDAGNAGDVIAAGADGVAVVSAICGAEDPAGAARGVRSAVDRALGLRLERT